MKSKMLGFGLFLGFMLVSGALYSETNEVQSSTVSNSFATSAGVAGASGVKRDSVPWYEITTECLAGAGAGLLIGTIPGGIIYWNAGIRVTGGNTPQHIAGIALLTGGSSIGAAAGAYFCTKSWKRDAHLLGTSLGSLAGTAVYFGFLGGYSYLNYQTRNSATEDRNMIALGEFCLGSAVVSYFIMPSVGAVIGNLIEDNLTRNAKKQDQVSLQVVPVITPDNMGLLAGIQF